MKVEKTTKSMGEVEVTMEELINQMKALKTGKAPGPDGLKPSIYKALIKSDKFLKCLRNSLNEILNVGQVPDSWKLSNTILIPKVNRPKVGEFRPIALTDISYKLLMGILKGKIEKHLIKTGEINDCQTGATSNRRVTENVFIVSYLINKCKLAKKDLFILSIDFRKAYDSIDRFKMIEVLKEFKIHPKIINLVAHIYSNDKTNIFLNSKLISNIEITSGIRQGCNLSGLIFILVTYKIIEKINKLNLGASID